MEYDWENKINVDKVREAAEDVLPVKYAITAIAFTNPDTGETCLIKTGYQDEMVTRADLWQDILGDAKRHYGDAYDHAFAKATYEKKPTQPHDTHQGMVGS